MRPQLNSQQQAAVTQIGTPLLVIAGAGSGKTRVIIEKIAYLINECGYSAKHIAAVTFTNKAAKEMKQRIAQRLDSRSARGLIISTFHTLGLSILKANHKALGFKPHISIYGRKECQALVIDLLGGDNSNQAFADHCLTAISNWKNLLISPDQAAAFAEDEEQQVTASIYQQFQQTLLVYNAVDFDDLLTLPVQLFRENSEILDAWRIKIRYLLVDEYQDTNHCQYEFVRLLVGDSSGLTAVGDDDQSIYAWRGARPDNLNQLQTDFPRLTIIKLEQNYRSTTRILRVANQLIENNPHLFDKKLWSQLGVGDPLRVLVTKGSENEAERVAGEIMHYKITEGVRYGQVAILYRGNHQSRPLENALRQLKIPYQITGGQSFFERTEIKDLIHYLRLLGNPDDDDAFLRAINTPRREIGVATINKLRQYAQQRGTSLLNASQELSLNEHLSAAQSQRLNHFADWCQRMVKLGQKENLSTMLKQLVTDIDYESWIGQQYKDSMAIKKRMSNVDSLVEWIAERESTLPELSDMVSRLALVGILDRQQDEEENDTVQMMTLHAAKGLEFPYVFMIGMEEDILPHKNSIEEGSIEEERRLAYVGITRAQRQLVFTMASKRKRYGEVFKTEPSRFLQELPQADLIWEGKNREANPAVSKKRGDAHLANLKDLLG